MSPSPESVKARQLKYLCGRHCIAEFLDRWMDRINERTAPPFRRAEEKSSRLEIAAGGWEGQANVIVSVVTRT